MDRLPAPGDPDLIAVLVVVFVGLGVTALLSAIADGRRPYVALPILAIAGLGAYWLSLAGPIDWLTFPNAFVEITARILR